MLQLTNNLSGKKESFKQLKQGEVSMYVCGVTLYDNIHIGHLKSILTFEVLRNYFKEKGFKVKFVRNITDIDDKIIVFNNPFFIVPVPINLLATYIL